jgi:molybdopterin-guanine dinucleotide biosynthesis protein A
MTLSAILLVGGLSRRMGADKATVVVTGKPLWRRQLSVLRATHPNALWVSARARPPWCPPQIQVVVDREPSRGPLSGVAAALRLLRTSHLLVLAVDLPHMSAEHLRKLSGLARQGCGVVPSHGDFLEPLCAIYPAEALTAAEAALNGSDVSLQSFARKLLHVSQSRVHDLTPRERSLYFNMNTPADLPDQNGTGAMTSRRNRSRPRNLSGQP